MCAERAGCYWAALPWHQPSLGRPRDGGSSCSEGRRRIRQRFPAARAGGWTVWDSGSVAVYPDDRGRAAVPTALAADRQAPTANPAVGPRAPGAAAGGGTTDRLRIGGLVLLSGEEPATPVRAARPQWTESLDPEAAESQELIRRLCGELPVRTIAAPGQAHAEVRELERWLWDSQPMVSVVIPVHNGARFLRRSISSIIGQRGARFQLIAVDDGSTDSSLSVLVALLPRWSMPDMS